MQQEINQTRELSSYEQLRVNNIKRNNARLRALGLISEAEEKQSNAAAEGITVLIVDESQSKYDQEYLDESPQKKRKRQDTLVEGSRKSLRLQGIGVDLTPIVVRNEEEIAKEREERVRECREARLKAAKAVAAAGAEKAAKENPTATYEHCLMRVKSMNDKRLANRVKAIERAAGKHCVVKMAIFKSCLQDEGKWDLAELASEALERLKSEKPPE